MAPVQQHVARVLNGLTHGGQSMRAMDGFDLKHAHELNAKYVQHLVATRAQAHGVPVPPPPVSLNPSHQSKM